MWEIFEMALLLFCKSEIMSKQNVERKTVGVPDFSPGPSCCPAPPSSLPGCPPSRRFSPTVSTATVSKQMCLWPRLSPGRSAHIAIGLHSVIGFLTNTIPKASLLRYNLPLIYLNE